MTLSLIILIAAAVFSLALYTVNCVVSAKADRTHIRRIMIIDFIVSGLGLCGALASYVIYRVSLTKSNLASYLITRISEDMKFFLLCTLAVFGAALLLTLVSVFISHKFRIVRTTFLIAATVLILIITRMMSLLMDEKVFLLPPYLITIGVSLVCLLFIVAAIDMLRLSHLLKKDGFAEEINAKIEKRETKKIEKQRIKERRKQIRKNGSSKR